MQRKKIVSGEGRDLGVVKALIEHVSKRGTDYDPSKLKYFSPHFIQYFMPESPASYPVGSEDSLALNPVYFTAVNMQIYDMFSAMFYIESEIFPQFTLANLPNIKPEHIITWIKEIHKRCAQTIVEENDGKAGEYSDGQVTRCHQGVVVLEKLRLLWSSTEFGKRFDNVELVELLKSSKLDEAEIKVFIELFERLEKDESLNLREYYPYLKKSKNGTMQPFSRLLYNLGVVYNENKLTESERKALEKFAKICLFPKDIEPAMQKFAVELLERLRACKATDDSVCELLAWTFQRQTDIHPFINGNGRNSMLFTNAVNRCFNQKGQYPSFLLRTPEQRNDKESSYSKAIDNIDSDISFLVSHFKEMLTLSREKKLETIPFEMELIKRRVFLALQFHCIRVNLDVNKITSSEARSYAFSYCSNKLQEFLKWAVGQVNEANRKAGKVVLTCTLTEGLGFFAKPDSLDVQENIKEIKPEDYLDLLKALTGLSDAQWKIYPKHKYITTAVVDSDLSFKMKKELDKHPEAFSVRVCKNGNETKTTLLTFENINYTELERIVTEKQHAEKDTLEGPP